MCPSYCSGIGLRKILTYFSPRTNFYNKSLTISGHNPACASNSSIRPKQERSSIKVMFIQQDLKIKTSRRYCMHMLAFMLCLFFFSLTTLRASSAQTQQILTLEQSGHPTPIAPYSYITLDKERILSPDTIVSRHRSNLRGERRNTDIINLGIHSAPSWVLFTVYNKSNIDDWVLDFGDTLDGRIGMIKKIYIMDYTTKQTITYPPSEDSKNPSPFFKNILPLKIKPGTQTTFILYIETDNGLPLIYGR